MINRSKITPEICQSNPTKIFVFGDNLIGKGFAGQACIRDEPNAFGILTKRLPSMSEGSFFSDKPEEWDAVVSRLRQLYGVQKHHDIIFPLTLGTGLARMPESSPNIFRWMNMVLRQHFNFENQI